MNTETFLTSCKDILEDYDVLHHSFLRRVASESLPISNMRIFFSHWYQMSKSHREAFPSLIANIKDDEVRFDLIGILYEEYGDGDRGRIHGKILERALKAVDINVSSAVSTKPLISTLEFDKAVKDVWLNGSHAYAYALHFGLEYLAMEQQKYFAKGMLMYDILKEADREYFEIHAEAEVRHVSESEFGFKFYANNVGNRDNMIEGLKLAKALLKNLWDEMELAVF